MVIGARVERVNGPLNRETAAMLQERLASRDDCGVLALDLASVEYVDSDGIRWLQSLQSDLTARQIELRLLIREGSRADRTLHLLRLDENFSIQRVPAG
jgi:anti-anti-sigma factor